MIKTKTVNRTGKSLVKKALVVKKNSVKQGIDAEKIKKLNEDVKAKKEAVITENVAVNTADATVVAVKEDKKYNLTIGLKDLLSAGCHLGHKVSKTHPKARENIYLAKDGIEIIDLVKTAAALEKAANFIYNAKRNGKCVVMLGTKRQAKEAVKRVALDAGVSYVTDRWLGGTISNWDQIKRNIKKLVDLKEGLEKGTFTSSTKKELLDMSKEIIRLEKNVGGLTNLTKLFDVLFVVDAMAEKTAIKEAKLRGVKVVAMVDTDTNPKFVDIAIPCNDDSVKSVNLVVEEIGKAIKAAGVK